MTYCPIALCRDGCVDTGVVKQILEKRGREMIPVQQLRGNLDQHLSARIRPALSDANADPITRPRMRQRLPNRFENRLSGKQRVTAHVGYAGVGLKVYFDPLHIGQATAQLDQIRYGLSDIVLLPWEIAAVGEGIQSFDDIQASGCLFPQTAGDTLQPVGADWLPSFYSRYHIFEEARCLVDYRDDIIEFMGYGCRDCSIEDKALIE